MNNNLEFNSYIKMVITIIRFLARPDPVKKPTTNSAGYSSFTTKYYRTILSIIIIQEDSTISPNNF